MKTFEQTWRWYGPDDAVSLRDIRQAGAEGIVTALHHIPNGETWLVGDIMARKDLIESAGLRWSVVESVPVHEAIKRQSPGFERYIDTYRETIRNLGQCGIKTICYNFMPVIDWTRTNLAFETGDGSRTLRFEMAACIAYDLFVLGRDSVTQEYSAARVQDAEAYFASLTDDAVLVLEQCILAGLPGSEESYSRSRFVETLAAYADISREQYRKHLVDFLENIVPEAENSGVRMAVHPDDPPVPLFGLPRILSTLDDFKWLTSRVESPASGLTLCTGSLGARTDNDLAVMARELVNRIHFVHLRNVRCDGDGNFTETGHLDGDIDLYRVMKPLMAHQLKTGRRIPARPDHGLQILDDLNRKTNPGYTAIGRLKGMAEIRGMGTAIERQLAVDSES